MIVAYTALHYGSVYLKQAIQSVIDNVDVYYVLYAAEGSHGTREDVDLPPSESRYNLQVMAAAAAGDKLQWYDGDWTVEGNQRDTIFKLAKRADAILVLDYDEVWPEGVAAQAIEAALQGSSHGYRLPMIHYWRCFRRAIMHDPAYPIRIITPRGTGESYIHTPPLNHLGYAIPTWLMEYKLKIHGHIGQFRKDIDWINDRWAVNAQQDCHPVGSEYWNPETLNPDDYMPKLMKKHRYYNMEVIE